MKILLTRPVKSLGKPGDVVDVSDGYARNYLLPGRLGVPACDGAVRQAESMRRSARTRESQAAARARELSAKLSGLTCGTTSPADPSGRLYGSIGEKDIVKLLSDSGVELDRRQIRLEEHLKTLGEHRVPVAVTETETVEITVRIDRA
jgi:large subunit ribosomal protein L9